MRCQYVANQWLLSVLLVVQRGETNELGKNAKGFTGLKEMTLIVGSSAGD